MLIFTNRVLDPGKTDLSAFGLAFAPEEPGIAVAEVARQGDEGPWRVSAPDTSVSQDDAFKLMVPKFEGDQPVLVYVHGFNNSPGTCVARCERLARKYKVEVIGFTWPAEGHLANGQPGDVPASAPNDDEKELEASLLPPKVPRKGAKHRYRRARINAEESAEALGTFLRLVAAARLRAGRQPFTLAAHSLGAHLLQQTLLQEPAAREAVAVADNVVLLAPCVYASGHADWIRHLRPSRRTYITYNEGDNVLFGSQLADGEVKLGTDPGANILSAPAFRYVRFTGTNTGGGGHRYFIESTDSYDERLFGRIFGSEIDVRPGEDDRKVYRFGCEHNGTVCWMAVAKPPHDGP